MQTQVEQLTTSSTLNEPSVYVHFTFVLQRDLALTYTLLFSIKLYNTKTIPE